MAIYHVATSTPTKAELIGGWLPAQSWGPASEVAINVVGSFRFDDPHGQVGLETHLVDAGGTLMQVPLTYRDAPLAGGEDALIGELEHSVLGTRWVYDGLGDERFVVMLAAAALTGQGEAVGMAVHDDRWWVAPSDVSIRGGGWTREPVPVDGFEPDSGDTADAILRNDRFELTLFRHPVHRERPPIGLTATLDGHPEPVVLAEIREHAEH